MEVLIVEARQYEHGDARIVVPWVFGFTEEARVAKRDSKLETARSSLAKGEDAFWEAIETSQIRLEWKEEIHDFVAKVREVPGCALRWLRTCIVDLPNIVPQGNLLSINRDGSLQLGLASWKPRNGGTPTERQSAAQKHFFDWLRATLDFSQDDLQSKQWPMVTLERWIPAAVQLAELIERLGS
jgi:hypothetical protein